jgi:hypothetical protein
VTAADCRWPDLPQRYDTALRDAVSFVFHEYQPLGIVATGTIIRGTAHATSDLDIVVIHDGQFRRRIQRWFGDVPAEIFVNPPHQIRAYFAEEHRDAEPLTAHMLATGFVVFSASPVVDELRSEARAWLERPSRPSDGDIVRARYGAATRFEDALDVASTDEAAATMLFTLSVTSMVELYCRIHLGRVPRRKDLLAAVDASDATLGQVVRAFFTATSFRDRRILAEDLADVLIGTRGFFEWDSGEGPTVR